ncbi:sigma 54-interacting transcriptional regulator [Deltaproteobacteria bacterium OttesenSCG-928-M10]|nr:sigma 54-interacting transcriptional regulator [Deltaproteobacteria bacterium OttesenSCG-928-M10]
MEPTLIITSPNSQFTEVARSVSEELRFKAIIIEAVLEEAVELILAACRQHDVSAVISRGGTANMIRQVLDIPVLVAEANDFDILTALLDAAVVSPQIAYVLSADYAIEELAWVTERFKISLRPYVFRNVEEMEKAVVQARRDGCRVVVSGSDNARRICDKYGLPCVLVNTSRRTMAELVRRAMLIAEVRDREIANRKKLSITLDLVPESVFFLDGDDRVSLVNHHGLDLLGLKSEDEIVGRPLADFIDDLALLKALSERKHHAGRVAEFSGKTLLLHSAPVFVQNNYLGMVVSLQWAADVERLEHRVRREVHSAGLTAEATFTDMEEVAASPAMRACLKRARQFAASGGTILITGESGAGKELLAQSIHNGSARRAQAFVAINCAALPLTLLESELFGYEEGAFTGAKRGGKPGYFELAHGGTLFLDELGLLPQHVQMQLLRVLQSRQVLRVGGRKMIPVDVRVVAATNADLAALVADGTFRQDLYYRINVLHLAIPPLRERPEDIPLLAGLYLPRFSRENNRTITGLSPALVRLFQAHGWPGNVRELLNYLMRLVVSAPGPVLTVEDLERSDIRLGAAALAGPAATAAAGSDDAAEGGADTIRLRPGSLESLEEEIIHWSMTRHNGSRQEVCSELGLSRTTLWKKLKKIGLEASRVGPGG